MPKLLKLLKRGDRISPTVYQFSPNTILCVHRDGNADICDSLTGACIKPIKWDGLREMGYSPALLLDGNEYCQHLALMQKPSKAKCIAQDALGAAGLMLLLISASALATAVTGCTPIHSSADLSASTPYPRTHQAGGYTSLLDEQSLAEFRRQNAHANKVLAGTRDQSVKAGGAL